MRTVLHLPRSPGQEKALAKYTELVIYKGFKDDAARLSNKRMKKELLCLYSGRLR